MRIFWLVPAHPADDRQLAKRIVEMVVAADHVADRHVMIVDYHRPAHFHPLRPLMHLVFRHLEPYAFDLWKHEVEHFMPASLSPAVFDKRTFFGGLYQKLVLTR